MDMFGRQRRALLVACVVVAVATGSAIAGARLASTTTASGRSITAVKTASDVAEFITQSSTFVDVPGAKATIKVPASTAALILVRFTGASQCGGNDPNGNSCSLRVEINGADAAPGEVVLDHAHYQIGAATARAADWSAGPLPAGTYAVQLQARASSVGEPSGTFRMGTWHLTVERVKV